MTRARFGLVFFTAFGCTLWAAIAQGQTPLDAGNHFSTDCELCPLMDEIYGCELGSCRFAQLDDCASPVGETVETASDVEAEVSDICLDDIECREYDSYEYDYEQEYWTSEENEAEEEISSEEATTEELAVEEVTTEELMEFRSEYDAEHDGAVYGEQSSTVAVAVEESELAEEPPAPPAEETYDDWYFDDYGLAESFDDELSTDVTADEAAKTAAEETHAWDYEEAYYSDYEDVYGDYYTEDAAVEETEEATELIEQIEVAQPASVVEEAVAPIDDDYWYDEYSDEGSYGQEESNDTEESQSTEVEEAANTDDFDYYDYDTYDWDDSEEFEETEEAPNASVADDSVYEDVYEYDADEYGYNYDYDLVRGIKPAADVDASDVFEEVESEAINEINADAGESASNYDYDAAFYDEYGYDWYDEEAEAATDPIDSVGSEAGSDVNIDAYDNVEYGDGYDEADYEYYEYYYNRELDEQGAEADSTPVDAEEVLATLRSAYQSLSQSSIVRAADLLSQIRYEVEVSLCDMGVIETWHWTMSQVRELAEELEPVSVESDWSDRYDDCWYDADDYSYLQD